MCTNFCSFLPKKLPLKHETENKNYGLKASVMKFMKPRSLWTAMKLRKKRQIHLKEKNDSKILTLEDWILSSPGFDKTNVRGGDFQVPNSSFRRVHPSFDGDLKEDYLSKFTENFTMEMSLKTEDTGGKPETSFSRTNIKKKVSFRSPEVAEVFVLDSPRIYVQQ